MDKQENTLTISELAEMIRQTHDSREGLRLATQLEQRALERAAEIRKERAAAAAAATSGR